MGASNSSALQIPSYSVCFVIVVVFFHSVFSNDKNLGDDLIIIKGQMNALLKRRQEDFLHLEKAFKDSWIGNSELTAVKNKLKELGEDIQRLKKFQEPFLTKQKNDRLTLQWLSLAVSELRTQFSETLTANNTSFQIQQMQELVTALNILRVDVASFRQDLEELKAQQKQTIVNFARLNQGVENNMINKQKPGETKSQIDKIKKDMEFLTKSLSKLKKKIVLLKVSISEEKKKQSMYSLNQLSFPSNQNFINSKNYRHDRLFRSKKIEYSGYNFQNQLDNNRNHFKKSSMNFSSFNEENFGDCNKIYEKLFDRLKKLEEAEKLNFKKTFNFSKQISELERLHLSILQLLETVENLETKVDKYIPNFQRDISKMEFSLDEITASFSIIKDGYEHQKVFLKTLANRLEKLEERLQYNSNHLRFLENQISNISKILYWKGSNSVGSNREEVQESTLLPSEEKLKQVSHVKNHSRISAIAFYREFKESDSFRKISSLIELAEFLKIVQKEYNTIIKQLPSDCGAIAEKKNGVYVIAPENGPPLLVACDMLSSPGGWTIVQRRIDGSEEFNRKWNEYATGFGTPSGEFWLGNEALHRLTLKNCSSLRIDFIDINGKNWVAEYEKFYVSDATDGYRIHISGYKGNASDALEYQNRMQFSTADSDRDISGTHCAQNYEGGWWFSHCQHVNLNGRYSLGLTWFDSKRNEWIAVTYSEMKVRRRKECNV